MLSDEEKEIFNNLKDYMQNNIDNGYHKFIYNDLGWDFKCIDCINAIDKVLKQSKEIEELFDYRTGENDLYNDNFDDMFRKINELVKAVNAIRKENNNGTRNRR